MNKEKLKEILIANGVLVGVVSLLFVFGLIPFSSHLYFGFLLAVVLSIVGQSLFLQGAETSLVKVGNHTGNTLMKKKNTFLVLLFGFILGLFATLAEPDVQVLADLVVPHGNPALKFLFMFVLGFGVGVLSLVAFARILKKLNHKIIFLIIYAIIVLLMVFSSETNIMLAFDASGTTTGIITVPFIMALTIGLCSMRQNNNSEDNFGVIGIATLGTIISYLVFALFSKNSIINLDVTKNSFWSFLSQSTLDSLVALLPLLAFFIIMQITSFKFPKQYFFKIIFGFFLSFVGLALFVTSVLYGFAPLAEYIALNLNSITIIAIFVIVLGFVLVFTEPAIKILMGQIEEGAKSFIKKRFVFIALSIAVAISLSLNLLKIIYGFNYLYIVIPLIVINLILMLFSPKLFTLIAFDSGGIVAGTILTSFVLPFFIGLSTNLTGSPNSALGVIATVTITPVIAIQTLGIIYRIKTRKTKQKKEVENE